MPDGRRGAGRWSARLGAWRAMRSGFTRLLSADTPADACGGLLQAVTEHNSPHRTRRLPRSLVAVLLLGGSLGGGLLVAGQAGATTTTLYVSPSGSSTNGDTSCSTAAYSTVQSAVTAATSGDTIEVCAGTYTVSDVVVSKPLTLAATGKVTLTGAGPIFNLTDSAGVRTVAIIGFTFSGVTGTGYNGVITVGGYGAGDVTIEHNVFKTVTDEAIGYHGNPGLTSPLGTGWKIIGNTVTNVTGTTNTPRDGMFLGNLSDSTIENNSVTKTAWAGIILTGTAQGDEASNIVAYNTVRDVPEEGIQVAFGTGDTVADNLVTNAGKGSTPAPVSGRNCAVCLYNTGQPGITVIGNTFTTSYEGVGVGQANASPGALGSGISVTGNTIAGDTTGLVDNATSGTLDATRNWWGCSGGPGTAACTTVVSASGATVNFSSWLTALPGLYVSPDGAAGNADSSCSTAAYTTIQAAVETAATGATIHVCAGTYTVHNVVVPKALTLAATGSVTLTGTGPIFNLTHGLAGVTTVAIGGFTFSDVTGVGYNGVITVGGYGAGNVTIEHNVFSHTTDEAIGYHGNHGLSGTLGKHWTIEKNIISDVTGNNTARDGMFLGNLSTSTVSGNTVTTTTWAGIILTAGTTPKPGYEHNNTVVDNTVKNVPEEGIQIAFGQNDVVSGNYVDDAGMGSATGPGSTAGQVSGRNCAVCLFDTHQTGISITGNTLTNSYEGVGVGQVSVSSAIGPLGTGIAVNGNNVTGDTEFGVANNASSGTLDATDNWWGSASGPYNASTNASGTGSSVSTDVSYRPWCTRASCTSPSPPPVTVPTTPPPAPTGATSSTSASSSSATSTAIATNSGTTASATGVGALTVAQYTSNPVGAPSFSSPGEYFDVVLSKGNSFSAVAVKDCNLNGGDSLAWWNPTASGGNGAWEPLKPAPAYTPGPPACVSSTLSASSSPSLSELTGTVFAAAITAPTTTAVSVTPSSVRQGASVTYSATVRSSSGTPTGTVSFSTNGSSLCTATLSGGSASCTATDAPLGTDAITGTYSGDVGHSGSSGTASLTVTIQPVAPAQGYRLVGADGGVFSFGDAQFFGSLPGLGVHVSDVVGTGVS